MQGFILQYGLFVVVFVLVVVAMIFVAAVASAFVVIVQYCSRGGGCCLCSGCYGVVFWFRQNLSVLLGRATLDAPVFELPRIASGFVLGSF